MLGRIPRLVMAAPIAAALAVTLAASSRSPAEPAGNELPVLKSISSRLDGAVSTVLIEASEPVAYLTSQPDPLTVLVDLRNVQSISLDSRAVNPLAPVSGVAVEDAKAPDGSPVARIRVSLDRAAKSRVRSSRNMILVEVDRGAANAPTLALATPVVASNVVPAAPRPAAAPPAPAAAVTRAAATELRSVKGAAITNGYSVTLSANGPLIASSVQEVKDLPPRLLLDFKGVAAGRVPATTAINQGDIERVRVATNSRDPLVTRVVIDLARKIPYTVEAVGEEVRILFQRAVEATSAVMTPTPEPARPAPAAVAAAPIRDTVPPPVASSVAARTAASPGSVVVPTESALAVLQAAQAPPPPVVAQPLAAPAGTAQRQFTGHLITLDFQGADLRAVLRTFAEISGLNIVIDPTINGTVDVSLREVPWDQALDIILRANKLGYSVDGTIVRIVPNAVLAAENEEKRKLADAEATAGVLRTVTVPLSYAKATELIPILKQSSLSQRGDVQNDPRTNTLIIRDLPDRLTTTLELISKLDQPQRQVEIEARIVQTNRNFARQLGVTWGFNGKLDPAIGTSTGLAFPNNGSVGGRTAPPIDVTKIAGSQVGLVLGSINGALGLDANLTALEKAGKIRFLSTPRVSTQSNIEASIEQGKQIPVQTISNNTTTTTFVPASLVLKVTPQITAAGTVIMIINVSNDFANYEKVTAAAPTPAIDTQRATTTVLVADGNTTVIGGIYQNSNSTTDTQTPLLHKLPFIGWLFKNHDEQETQTELLIFITPRIIQ